MNNDVIINTLHLCSALLNHAAVELNGGRPLPAHRRSSIPAGLFGLIQAKTKQQSPAPGKTRGCAIVGCTRPLRAKGYCGAHGQKRLMLRKSNRLPSSWKDYAAPGTVADLPLPRGRPAAKLLAQHAAKKAS